VDLDCDLVIPCRDEAAALPGVLAAVPEGMGVLVVDNMLWHDRVADPAARDETTSTLRDLGKALRDHDDLVTALLPVSDGVLVAVRR